MHASHRRVRDELKAAMVTGKAAMAEPGHPAPVLHRGVRALDADPNARGVLLNHTCQFPSALLRLALELIRSSIPSEASLSPGRRARLAPRSFAIDHQRHVMNGLEQKAPHEAAEPPVDRLPARKILRRHSPAASGARDAADGVQHLPHVDARLSPLRSRLRQKRRYPLPLLVPQVGRLSLRLLLNVGHSAGIRWVPHSQRESRPACQRNHSQTVSEECWFKPVSRAVTSCIRSIQRAEAAGR